MRKPELACRASASRFPLNWIFKKIMVGDTITDLQFGSDLGMKTFLFGTGREEQTPDVAWS